MPELPEVETVRRGLEPVLTGRVIAHADVRRPDLRRPFPPGLAASLTGARVTALRRRSKYLLADLDRGETLIVHLGMSGRVLVSGAPVGVFHHPHPAPEKHDHVVLDLDDGARLTFNDARRFGLIDLVPTPVLDAHPLLAGLGPEPLGNAFSAATLAARMAGRFAPVKAILLDAPVGPGARRDDGPHPAARVTRGRVWRPWRQSWPGLLARVPLHRATYALPVSNDDAIPLLMAAPRAAGRAVHDPLEPAVQRHARHLPAGPAGLRVGRAHAFRAYEAVCGLLLIGAVGLLAGLVAGEAAAAGRPRSLAAVGTPYMALMAATGPTPNFLMPLLSRCPVLRRAAPARTAAGRRRRSRLRWPAWCRAGRLGLGARAAAARSGIGAGCWPGRAGGRACVRAVAFAAGFALGAGPLLLARAMGASGVEPASPRCGRAGCGWPACATWPARRPASSGCRCRWWWTGRSARRCPLVAAALLGLALGRVRASARARGAPGRWWAGPRRWPGPSRSAAARAATRSATCTGWCVPVLALAGRGLARLGAPAAGPAAAAGRAAVLGPWLVGHRAAARATGAIPPTRRACGRCRRSIRCWTPCARGRAQRVREPAVRGPPHAGVGRRGGGQPGLERAHPRRPAALPRRGGPRPARGLGALPPPLARDAARGRLARPAGRAGRLLEGGPARGVRVFRALPSRPTTRRGRCRAPRSQVAHARRQRLPPGGARPRPARRGGRRPPGSRAAPASPCVCAPPRRLSALVLLVDLDRLAAGRALGCEVGRRAWWRAVRRAHGLQWVNGVPRAGKQALLAVPLRRPRRQRGAAHLPGGGAAAAGGRGVPYGPDEARAARLAGAAAAEQASRGARWGHGTRRRALYREAVRRRPGPRRAARLPARARWRAARRTPRRRREPRRRGRAWSAPVVPR